jgi:hypothetical protein
VEKMIAMENYQEYCTTAGGESQVAKKPMQREKMYKCPDNDDLLEATENALDSLADAMIALRGWEEFASWFDAIGELYDEIKPEHDMYEQIAEAEDEAELDAMNREYWASVI